MSKASRSMTYALGLGSNRPRSARLSPAALVEAAIEVLGQQPLRLFAASPIIASAPLGPSLRRFANAAVLVETALPPPALLAYIKTVERDFGRRRGQRWAARTLDIDILLWSGGRWRERRLTIPHPAYRERDFVLVPLAGIAPHWRDPANGLSPRRLLARLTRPKPVDPRGKRL
jgi:2-amino-4-hydroxy-6-hydroxymethyldihydropteridine diphosphokinase